jgi:hypothetical protein
MIKRKGTLTGALLPLTLDNLIDTFPQPGDQFVFRFTMVRVPKNIFFLEGLYESECGVFGSEDGFGRSFVACVSAVVFSDVLFIWYPSVRDISDIYLVCHTSRKRGR